MRQIGLLDCNNFFVSCERLFRPDLLKKPVAVLSSNDGCIVARSQEVKAMGVPMGIPLFQAKQLVDMSSVTLFSSNFTLYRDLSARVMETLRTEVDEVEVYSVDEAFFRADGLTVADARVLRRRIMLKTGIPVSIGIAATKTLAKEASEIGKKSDGVCLLTPELWEERSKTTSSSDIWGLGRATAAKLTEMGVQTAAEYIQLERRVVRKHFGVMGERIYDELKGVCVYDLGDDVEHNRQSLTSSRSFAATTSTLAELESAVAYHVAQVGNKLRRHGLAASLMYLELRAGRHSDFAYRKGGTEVLLSTPTNSTQELTQEALAAARQIFDADVPYKKAGVTVAGLIPETYLSASLFSDTQSKQNRVVDEVVDAVQKRFGFAALHNAVILPNRDRSSVRLRSKAYTTSWGDIPRVKA